MTILPGATLTPATIATATGAEELAAALNRDCLCVTVNHETLRRELDADGANADLYDKILATRPNLFSDMAVFVTGAQVERMREIIRAVETVVALPAYREEVTAEAPEISRFNPGPRGVFMGYDFHLGPAGPQLIEINTNAGGALLNVALARAQAACCETMKPLIPGPARVSTLDDIFFQMFLCEWRRQRSAQPLTGIAIMDDAPREQYLYPEFLLFERLFRRHGLKAVIADPAEIRIHQGKLWHENEKIDLVYNRLTDFALEEPRHAVLRQAYLEGSVVLTPHPRAHALYADKRNLVALTDGARLRAWQIPEPVIHTLLTGIPRTVPVTRADAERLWARRHKLFFKPAAGYGAKAAYPATNSPSECGARSLPATTSRRNKLLRANGGCGRAEPKRRSSSISAITSTRARCNSSPRGCIRGRRPISARRAADLRRCSACRRKAMCQETILPVSRGKSANKT